MKALLFKELRSLFYSKRVSLIAVGFLLILSYVLWIHEWPALGEWEYSLGRWTATMFPFFAVAPFAFAILVPSFYALLFAKTDKRDPKAEMRANPIRSYWSSFVVPLVFLSIILLATLVYVWSVYSLIETKSHFDFGLVAVSYFGLYLLLAVYVAVCITLSLFIRSGHYFWRMGMAVCILIYFAGIFLPREYAFFGLAYHYKHIISGEISIRDITVFLNYISVIFLIALITRGFHCWKNHKPLVAIILGVNIALYLIPNYHLDCTQDKMYSLTTYTKEYLSNLRNDSARKVKVQAYLSENKDERYRRVLAQMEEQGGEAFQVLYTPRESDSFIEVESQNKERRIDLRWGSSSLEYDLMKAMTMLDRKEPKDIAYIEGHGELEQVYVYSSEEILSKDYNVHRGEIGNQVGILDGFSAIIIAGPQQKFNESEKYVLDQYIMQGGRVLWLVDGVYYSVSDLAIQGWSASIKNDVNLDDVLANYGVRIAPLLVQASYCSPIILISDDENNSYVQHPYPYYPILGNAAGNSLAGMLGDVKSKFVSPIDFTEGSAQATKSILLSTMGRAHLVDVPERIDFRITQLKLADGYYDKSNQPIAVALDGIFNSAYAGRILPNGIKSGTVTEALSKSTKMIVVGTASIIQNELQGQGENTQVMPLGYERALDETTIKRYANDIFILSAVNWLTEDDELISLSTKEQNYAAVIENKRNENKLFYMLFNMLLPVILVGIIFLPRFALRNRS